MYSRFGGVGYNRMSAYGAPPLPPGAFPGQQQQQNPLEQGSQAAFQMLESLVQAFGGLAQMLESTYFATHSSFMAMMGLAEHFGQLRSYFGQLFGVFTIVRTLRRWTGGRDDGKHDISVDAFLRSANGRQDQSTIHSSSSSSSNINNNQLQPQRPRLSKLPIFIFLLVTFGIPYFMHRLMRILQQRPPQGMLPSSEGAHTQQWESSVAANQQQEQLNQDATTPAAADVAIPSLRFARALFDFQGQNPQEISFRKGDIIGIVTMDQGDWWRGKVRFGPIGYFPHNHVALMEESPVNKGALDLPATSEVSK